MCMYTRTRIYNIYSIIEVLLFSSRQPLLLFALPLLPNVCVHVMLPYSCVFRQRVGMFVSVSVRPYIFYIILWKRSVRVVVNMYILFTSIYRCDTLRILLIHIWYSRIRLFLILSLFRFIQTHRLCAFVWVFIHILCIFFPACGIASYIHIYHVWLLSTLM